MTARSYGGRWFHSQSSLKVTELMRWANRHKTGEPDTKLSNLNSFHAYLSDDFSQNLIFNLPKQLTTNFIGF